MNDDVGVLEIGGGKRRRDAEHGGTSGATGGDARRRVLDDETITRRSAELLRGEQITIGGRLAALYVVGGHESSRH